MTHDIQHRTFDEQRVRRNFVDTSKFYDYWAYFTESKAGNRLLELAGIQNQESILEVGVGTGILFKQITKRNRQGLTAGIDLSSDMLGKARKRLSYRNDKGNILLRQASAYHLPFDNKAFDCLISCYVLDLLPEDDFRDILSEFNRVLKPGGRLMLASMSFGWSWYHHLWERLAAYFPDLFTDCRPINLKPFVINAEFRIKRVELISQNTFPSQVLKAKKDR